MPPQDVYRDLFESVDAALFVHDPARGALEMANPAACALCGADLEALRAAWPGILADPERSDVDVAAFLESAVAEKETRDEWPAPCASGPRWVAVTARSVVLSGQPRVLVEVRDLSGERATVQALQAKERELEDANRMLHLVLDSIPVRVFWKDRDLRYLGCNAWVAKDAGVERPEDVIGRRDEDLPWRSEAGLYAADDKVVMETGRPRVGYQEPQTRPGGQVGWLETSKIPLFDRDGAVIGVLGTYEDITARRVAEQALREREEDLRITLDSIADAVIAADTEGWVRRVNRVAEALTGWRAGDALGRRLSEVLQTFHPETRSAMEDPVQEILRGRRGQERRVRLLMSKDGGERRIEESGAPIRDASGRVRGVVVAFRDVTEAHALQEKLGHAHRMEAVGQLAGGVAHDFNNHLQVILGYTNLVLEDLEPEDPNRECLSDVVVAAERASTLTRQLLAFSRRETTEPRALEVNEIIRGVEKLMRRVVGEQVGLRLELAEPLPPVRADPRQVELVLLNLCINARDAMPTGGHLEVRTRLHAVEPSGAFVQIQVRDDGRGFSAEEREQVFDPFHSTQATGEGIGLGLASVRAIAEAHGGFVELDSAPGRGSEFRVHLPVIPASAEPGPEEPVLTADLRGGERVLFAEDENMVRALGERILSDAGYTVVAAVDGDDAERRFLAEPDRFDLVLLDVAMPKKNGEQVFRTIHATRPDLPVLFCSAYAGAIPAGSLAAAVPLVQKPFKPKVLLEAIRAVLGGGPGRA